MAETTTPQQTRLYYPPDATPFGELNLLRADHKTISLSTVMDPVLNVLSGYVVQEAWLNSEWLQQTAGKERLEELEDEARLPFALSVHNGANHSFYFPHEQVSWFAVKPPQIREIKILTLPNRGLGPYGVMPSQVIGFASAKHDISGNWLQKIVKRRFQPEKIYANVSDVDVLTAHQGKKIGAALFFAGLQNFNPEQVPTTYVSASNKPLIEKLGELSYKPTGSRLRKDLLPDVEIEEVRLQGESVGVVRKQLVSKFPWLEESVAIDS